MAEFSNDSISGTEFERRPGLQAMLAATSCFDVLIVSEQKRIGRESVDTATEIERRIARLVKATEVSDNPELIERLKALEASRPAAPLELPEYWRTRAKLAEKEGRELDALSLYMTALRHFPSHAETEKVVPAKIPSGTSLGPPSTGC